MLDIFKLRLEEVLDFLRSGLLRRMLLAEYLRNVRRATSVPCENLKILSGGS